MRRALVSDGNLDARMIAYLVNFLAALLRVILVVSILVYFGVQTASFAALLAGAGLAMWVPPRAACLALAAGVFLMANRPFGVGEFITGALEAITKFATIFRISILENLRILSWSNLMNVAQGWWCPYGLKALLAVVFRRQSSDCRCRGQGWLLCAADIGSAGSRDQLNPKVVLAVAWLQLQVGTRGR